MRQTILALVLLPALAGAQVPQKLGYQGRLLMADGTPEAGVVSVTFSFFGAATSGSALWTEPQTLALADGFYATQLGAVTALPASAFDGADLFLEVSAGGAALSPRHQLASVAYALAAGSARNVSGGKVEASSLTVGGKPVVDSSGKVDFAQLKACASAGEILKWDGSAWLCGADQGLTGKVGPAQLADCGAAGDILKWDGSAWKCAPDAGGLTAVAVGGPLIGNGTAGSPIALPKAGAGADGYLSAADHAAFAAKAADADLARVAKTGAYGDLNGRPAALPPNGPAGGDLAGSYPNPAIGTGKITNAHLASDPASLANITAGALSVAGTGAHRTVTVDGRLSTGTNTGPHGYVKFFTDRVTNPSTTANQNYVLLDMRCSGHWGSYYAQIELVTYYYLPSVRRYEFFCGNGNHTTGGTLREVFATQVTGLLASLALTNVRSTVHQHSGITMYESQLVVTQAAYAASYAHVVSYGLWPSEQKGTAFSDTSPSAVWQTWTR